MSETRYQVDLRIEPSPVAGGLLLHAFLLDPREDLTARIGCAMTMGTLLARADWARWRAASAMRAQMGDELFDAAARDGRCEWMTN